VRAWHRFEYNRHFTENTNNARLFSGCYESFAVAIAAAPKQLRFGHDHEELADRHTSEIGHIWPSDYPVLFWLKTLIQKDSRVFDLGGATGLLFYGFQAYMTFGSGLRWTICEVPSVVRRGRELAQAKGARGVCFTSDVQEASRADIFLASGSLQFIEPNIWSSLASLDLRPRHLILNRIPLYDGPSFVTLHNMGKAVCPCHIWNEREFISHISRLGYDLRDKWDVPEFGCYIPFHPTRSVKHYAGMYFEASQRESASEQKVNDK